MAKKEGHAGAIFGSWALILGIMVAFISAIFPNIPFLAPALVILGIIIGIVNLPNPHTEKFTIGCIALAVAANATLSTGFIRLIVVSPATAMYLKMVSINTISIVVPALVIVSIKNFYELTK